MPTTNKFNLLFSATLFKFKMDFILIFSYYFMPTIFQDF